MIKIKSKKRGFCPPILNKRRQDKIALATQKIKALYDSDSIRFDNRDRKWDKTDIDSSVYGHSDIKSQLISSQYGKCAFCERNIVASDYGDIEHFRPKRAWQQSDKQGLQGPGYYWLSYDYDNLLFACEICNERNKRNHFPIRRPEYRAINHHNHGNLIKEKPFFVNPAKEDPKWLIRFKEAMAVGIDKNNRGKKTIEVLGLNRKAKKKGVSDLYELRLTHFRLVQNTFLVASQSPNPNLTQAMIDDAINLMEEMRNRSSQYSAMVNDNFPRK